MQAKENPKLKPRSYTHYRTGTKYRSGHYDITLKQAADAIRQGDATPISIFLQEQLGLKLITAKAPIEVIMVDRIGKLIQN